MDQIKPEMTSHTNVAAVAMTAFKRTGRQSSCGLRVGGTMFISFAEVRIQNCGATALGSANLPSHTRGALTLRSGMISASLR